MDIRHPRLRHELAVRFRIKLFGKEELKKYSRLISVYILEVFESCACEHYIESQGSDLAAPLPHPEAPRSRIILDHATRNFPGYEIGTATCVMSELYINDKVYYLVEWMPHYGPGSLKKVSKESVQAM